MRFSLPSLRFGGAFGVFGRPLLIVDWLFLGTTLVGFPFVDVARLPWPSVRILWILIS